MIALLGAAARAMAAVPAPYRLIVERPDGSLSETRYPSQHACERARRALSSRMEARERSARRNRTGRPVETRWMIGPSCLMI